MKILIWVLNIIQFIIVYFLVFSLFFTGVLQAIDPSIGLSGETLWPIMSIGIAGVPWKYYNRFSLFITSIRLKAPAEELVVEEASNTIEKKGLGQTKTKRSEILYTFFFGYFSLKWRRLIRTLLLLPYIPCSIVVFYKTATEREEFLIFYMFFPAILLAIISWVIKPFVVKED